MNNFKSYKGSGQGQSKSKKPKYLKPYGKNEFRSVAQQSITHMELFTKENYEEMSIINIPTELDRSVQLSFLSWSDSPPKADVIKHTITQENDNDQYFNALQILKNLIDPRDEDLASHVNITLPLLKTKNELGIPNMELALISFLRNNIDFIGTTKKKQSLQNSEDIALNTISLEYHDKKYISGSHDEYDESWDSFNILKSQRQDGNNVDYPLNQALKVWLAYLEFYQYFPMEPENEWIYKLNGKDVPDWKVISPPVNNKQLEHFRARYKLFLKYFENVQKYYPRIEQDGAEKVSQMALQDLLGVSPDTPQGDSKTEDVASEKKQEAPQQRVSESLSIKDYSDSKYDVLRTQLESLNLKIEPVADNGDCMFEAMSKFLIKQGIEVNTKQVRTTIVTHIVDNWADYSTQISGRCDMDRGEQWCHYPSKYQEAMMMEPDEQGQMPQGYIPQSRFGGASELTAFSKIEWGDQEKKFNFQLLIIGDNNELLPQNQLLGFAEFDKNKIHRVLNLLLDQQNLHYSLLLPIAEAASKEHSDDIQPVDEPVEPVIEPVKSQDITESDDYLKFLGFFDKVKQFHTAQKQPYKDEVKQIIKLLNKRREE